MHDVGFRNHFKFHTLTPHQSEREVKSPTWASRPTDAQPGPLHMARQVAGMSRKLGFRG